MAGALLTAALLALGACASEEVPEELRGGAAGVRGERISVLTFETRISTDPEISRLQVRLPAPRPNGEWPGPGGYPSHAMQHLDIVGGLERVWSRSAGTGSSGSVRLITQPIVAGRRIFTLDASARVTAFDADSGSRLWRRDLTPEGEDSEIGFGGGLAHDAGRLFVTTGFGFAAAIDPATGEVIWRRDIGVPLRSAPTAAEGIVLLIDTDNQLHALSQSDGSLLWTYTAIAEIAGLMGGASPAVVGDLVVAAFSSGEIVALRTLNGRIAWSDVLSREGLIQPLAALNDIHGHPVIDGNMVFAISHSGRIAAFDLFSGTRVWDIDLAGVETPWVAGDFIYVMTLDAELVCLTRGEGRIRWIRSLPRFEDLEDREDPIQWSGPVLVSDRLLVMSSNGFAVSVSPYTGRVLGQRKLEGDVFLSPIVARRTLFYLTDDAELLALR